MRSSTRSASCARCVSDTTSQNHGDATKLAASAAAPSRLHIEPALLQAEALQALRGRRDMGVDLAEAADRIGPVAHELHYEDLQRDAVAEVRRLLEKGLGVRSRRRGAGELLGHGQGDARGPPAAGSSTSTRSTPTCGRGAVPVADAALRRARALRPHVRRADHRREHAELRAAGRVVARAPLRRRGRPAVHAARALRAPRRAACSRRGGGARRQRRRRRRRRRRRAARRRAAEPPRQTAAAAAAAERRFAARDGGEPCTADEERLCARLLAELRVNTSLLCTLRTPTAAEAAANNDRGGRKKPKGELEAALKQAGKAGGEVGYGFSQFFIQIHVLWVLAVDGFEGFASSSSCFV